LFFLISLLTGSLLISCDKGQLISEAIFLGFKSRKKQTNLFDGFLLASKIGQIKEKTKLHY